MLATLGFAWKHTDKQLERVCCFRNHGRWLGYTFILKCWLWIPFILFLLIFVGRKRKLYSLIYIYSDYLFIQLFLYCALF